MNLMDNKKSTMGKSSKLYGMISESIVLLLLIVAAPNWSLIMLYISVHHKGDFQKSVESGWYNLVTSAWKQSLIYDYKILMFLAIFTLWAVISQFIFGGKSYRGPPTASGYQPVYRHSGFRYYLASISLFTLIFNLDSFSAIHWYEKLVILAGSLNIYGVFVCLLLLIKAVFYRSPGDFVHSGNPICDFYWGLELYPRLGKTFDIKLFTNSRFGLMLWQLIVLLSWKAQHEMSGWNWSMACCAILQTIYLAKFYWWEDGYMKSLDIILDRAGFYICWGCIYLVPTFYTLTSVYMVHNSPVISTYLAIGYLSTGALFIILNYWSDYQRQLARNFNGNCHIWGSKAKIIRATYVDVDNKERTSILLASGFWGLSRHINYLFEIGSAFLWEIPCQFSSIIPYTYLIFLTILLFHRSQRDEAKCKAKYGKFWDRYCQISNYRIIPFIY